MIKATYFSVTEVTEVSIPTDGSESLSGWIQKLASLCFDFRRMTPITSVGTVGSCDSD